MTREEKLSIAKRAYEDIKRVIDGWEESAMDGESVRIMAHWDECITVDDELFHSDELRKGIFQK